MPNIAIHSTPKKKSDSVERQGLKKQPFWKSAQSWRQPTRFRFSYNAKVSKVSGKTKKQIFEAVYNSIRAANIHLTKSSRKKFKIAEIAFFLVDLDKSRIIGEKEKQFYIKTGLRKRGAKFGGKLEDYELAAPSEALTRMSLSNEEIISLERETANLHWSKANNIIAEAVTVKLLQKLNLLHN